MKTRKRSASRTPNKPADGATGTYRFDPKLGKVVKVSSKVPSVASKSGDKPACGDASSPCASDGCGMGGCGMGGGF